MECIYTTETPMRPGSALINDFSCTVILSLSSRQTLLILIWL